MSGLTKLGDGMNKHGNMFFSWEKDLLTIEIKGGFNKEGMEFWFSEIKKYFKNNGFKVWRRLEIWDEEAMVIPEAIEVGKLIYDWLDDNGCTLTAVVIKNNLQEKIIKERFKSHVKIFRNKEKAREWLDSAHKPLKQDK